MTKGRTYQKRFYRDWIKDSDLIQQEVMVGETDLLILSEVEVKDVAERLVIKYRREIESYIMLKPEFLTSLTPIEIDNKAPLIIKEMLEGCILANVGPMAGVAGAIAEFVGKDLLTYSKQVIIENGGDIFIKTESIRRIGIFAGNSPLSNKIFIKIKPEQTPLGICTSSGTVGHSLSFGKADACVIISPSPILADTVATATCNRIKVDEDINPAMEFAMGITGIKGVVIILGDKIGSIGDVELTA